MNHGALRGALVTYGIAAFAYFQSRAIPGGWILVLLGAGVGLQVILFAVRKLVERRDREGASGEPLAPRAMELAGLVADGVSVLLFALGTFRGMAGQVDPAG